MLSQTQMIHSSGTSSRTCNALVVHHMRNPSSTDENFFKQIKKPYAYALQNS